MANQRNIEAMEAGRQATVVGGAIRGYVDERMREQVIELIGMYRNGQVHPISHDMLIGKVAEMTALSDMLSDLENTARIGETAARREFGDATQK